MQYILTLYIMIAGGQHLTIPVEGKYSLQECIAKGNKQVEYLLKGLEDTASDVRIICKREGE